MSSQSWKQSFPSSLCRRNPWASAATSAGQTRQSLENVRAVLAQAGLGMENIIKTTVFLKDMNDFAAMNEVYASFFTGEPPARSAVEVARLPKDALVEIDRR